MRKRAIAAAAIAAAVSLVVAGCSSSGSGGSSSGSTLTYWASNQGTSLDNDKQVLTPVLDKFTKETGVKVKLEVIGWNDLQTRIQTAITSNSGPDVLNIGNTWAASLQATGAFMPYDDAAFQAIGGKDKFVKPALDTGGAPGKDVTSVKTGDRVGWSHLLGAYAEYEAIAADRLVPIPAGVSDQQAAATMLQGMTAHYLLHDSYPLKKGETALVHAAAGGVGSHGAGAAPRSAAPDDAGRSAA